MVFLETLILSYPLFAVQAALAFGVLSAAPFCRVVGPEVSPISGSDLLEQSCMLHVSVQHGSSAYLLHATCACALLGAVLYDGWASTVRRLRKATPRQKRALKRVAPPGLGADRLEAALEPDSRRVLRSGADARAAG